MFFIQSYILCWYPSTHVRFLKYAVQTNSVKYLICLWSILQRYLLTPQYSESLGMPNAFSWFKFVHIHPILLSYDSHNNRESSQCKLGASTTQSTNFNIWISVEKQIIMLVWIRKSAQIFLWWNHRINENWRLDIGHSRRLSVLRGEGGG